MEERFSLRKTYIDLSPGTHVRIISNVKGMCTVETVAPIPVVHHRSWFDKDGKQHHEMETVRSERRTFDVHFNDLTKLKRGEPRRSLPVVAAKS